MSESWKLVYEGYDPEQEMLREALCTLGNGYFATRGAGEETDAVDDVRYPGTYLAGGYNRLETPVADRMIVNEDLVNFPNWLCLSFRPSGGDWFSLDEGEVLSYRQELDLLSGVLSRDLLHRDTEGRETRVETRRLVHMRHMHLAALEMTITPQNWSGKTEIRSAVDGSVINSGVARYRQLNSVHLEPLGTEQVTDDTVLLKTRTTQSEISMGMAARTRVTIDGKDVVAARETDSRDDYVSQTCTVAAEQGTALVVDKVVALFTSRDRALSDTGRAATYEVARAGSFSALVKSHVLAWKQLWRRGDIVLEPSDGAQMIVRLHIFHLLQTVSPNSIDLDIGMPARGWHGEAYRGHIFWDEIYIFPYLNFRIPEITRALLLYRYRRLDEARDGARDAGHRGAMYPWQSGSSGREETQVVHLNPKSGRWIPDKSRLQRHVNIAIAYNVWQYYQTTGDLEFMLFYGAEMMLEIARFWASLATFNAGLGRYEIHGIMGPDEYHEEYPGADEAGLKNNSYTNIMVSWLLWRAQELLDLLPETRREELTEAIGLSADEVSRWDEISRKMQLCFHDDGILSQFEGYDDLKEFDWDGYRKKYGKIGRLDRILEAEGDNTDNYKLSKQADALMLPYLLSSDMLGQLFERMGYPFEPELIPRIIDYYLERTSHGSTLSGVVNSWVLSRSDRKRSWDWFMEALHSDVADVQGGTTREGVHLGAMAGTVDIVQRCYTGLSIRDNVLWLRPELPEALGSIKQRIRFQGHWLALEITSDHLHVTCEEGGSGELNIGVGGEVHRFAAGDSQDFDL